MMRTTVFAFILLALALTACALTPKGYLATALSMSTTNPNDVRGPDKGYVEVIRTPSTFEGFCADVYLYVKAKTQMEAETIASAINGYYIEKLTALAWVSDDRIGSGDFLLDTLKDVTMGSEGASNTMSSSQSTAYSGSTCRGGYFNAQSSSTGTSTSTDATVVDINYQFTIKRKDDKGNMIPLPALKPPLGGADSTPVNQRSTDRYSHSSDYNYRNRGSSFNRSFVSTSTMYRSPNIAQAQMKRKIEGGTVPDIASLAVDAITNAAVMDKVPGAIFRSAVAPQTPSAPSNDQNITATLQ